MGAHTWQRHWQGYWAEHPYFETGCGAAMPFLTLFNAGLALAFIVILVSLLTNGTVIGQELPGGTPVWLAVVILLFAYNLGGLAAQGGAPCFLLSWSFRRATRSAVMMVTLWDSLIWLAFLGVLAWLASRHFPQVQEAVHNIPSRFS